jgi:hypothetical protein
MKSGNNLIGIGDPANVGFLYMEIHKDNAQGRFVRMNFEGVEEYPLFPECAKIPMDGDGNPLGLYFLGDKKIDVDDAWIFRFGLRYLYNVERDANGKLELTCTNTYFNLAKMSPGQTAIVSSNLEFHVADDPSTRRYNESSEQYNMEFFFPVRVTYSDADFDGQFEWVVRPILEPYFYVNEQKDYPDGSLVRRLISNGYMHCCHCKFNLLFELTFERM